MANPFWTGPISGDTAEHAKYGVGPATDYPLAIGSPIVAPFAGTLTSYWTDAGGNSLKLDGEKFQFFGQHLKNAPVGGFKEWRSTIALSGNTGRLTTGPHIHAYIIVKATGKRISFSEWLRDYINAPAPASAPTPAPAATNGYIGRTIKIPSFYWYRNASDARVTRNPQGGKYGGGIMLSGPYQILDVDGGALLVGSKAVGRVWLHPSAINYLR